MNAVYKCPKCGATNTHPEAAHVPLAMWTCHYCHETTQASRNERVAVLVRVRANK